MTEKDLYIKANLHENETLEDLQLNGIHLIQNKNMFCFGVDSVLLSKCCKAKKDDVVLDLCTGTGVIPLLIYGMTGCKNFIGVEIQEKSFELAKRNAILNGLEKNINFINDDIKTFTLKKEVSIVTCNPPYMYNTGYKNAKDEMTIARHEVLCSLEDIISCANRNLKYGGKFYMVHRAERLCDIFYHMRLKKIEPKVLYLVKPTKDKVPNLIVVEGLKGGKPSLRTEEIIIDR
ncbi:MAG: tRNA1(Val) (adenine(37)-N6)-methyltransferase [Lachnospirales bacterium]